MVSLDWSLIFVDRHSPLANDSWTQNGYTALAGSEVQVGEVP